MSTLSAGFKDLTSPKMRKVKKFSMASMPKIRSIHVPKIKSKLHKIKI